MAGQLKSDASGAFFAWRSIGFFWPHQIFYHPSAYGQAGTYGRQCPSWYGNLCLHIARHPHWRLAGHWATGAFTTWIIGYFSSRYWLAEQLPNTQRTPRKTISREHYRF